MVKLKEKGSGFIQMAIAMKVNLSKANPMASGYISLNLGAAIRVNSKLVTQPEQVHSRSKMAIDVLV